jgi:hypothetical protein
MGTPNEAFSPGVMTMGRSRRPLDEFIGLLQAPEVEPRP